MVMQADGVKPLAELAHLRPDSAWPLKRRRMETFETVANAVVNERTLLSELF